ncbi:hypothetical protein T484DRAFT_1938827 [Baffinella frigidus]|nr:hypothetical protein T484DRAFT_1938827 [Cryptophyta sp. CCMP2293]
MPIQPYTSAPGPWRALHTAGYAGGKSSESRHFRRLGTERGGRRDAASWSRTPFCTRNVNF